MSEEQIQKYLEERNRILYKKVVYPVIIGVIMMLAGAIYTYFGKININEKRIESLELSKVDQANFNEYLQLQSKINTLTEERQRILSDKMDAIDKKIGRIDEINVEIARLQEQIKNILKPYSMQTRGNEEVILPIESFIKQKT